MSTPKDKLSEASRIVLESMPVTFLGIDPGKSGGLFWIQGVSLQASAMPSTDKGIWDYLRDVKNQSGAMAVVLEEIGEGGIYGANKSSAMKLYANYRVLRAFLEVLGIPHKVVRSAAIWRKLGIPPRRRKRKGVEGESSTEWKNRLRAKAEELFPAARLNLKVSDAALMAYYARLLYKEGL